MRRKPHNCVALSLAELTARACDIIAVSRRAYHHKAPRRRVRRSGITLRLIQHHYYRPGFLIGEFIRVGEIVCRKIDRKTCPIGGANGLFL
jgi:hypothetical protein